MPINNGKTMEQVFLEIARNHGAAMQNGKMLLSVFCDLSRDTQDQRLVRYFVECDGPAELMAVKSLSPAMQQARFQQTVNKISAKTLIPEESARRVCNAFWCATGGRSMVQTTRQPEVRTAQQPNVQPKAKTPVYRQQLPAPQQPAVFPKERFLMTKREHQNGGDLYVYYDDGTRELVHFPPNAQNHQPGLPRKLQSGRDVIVWKPKKPRHPGRWAENPLLDYSDGRLEDFARMGILREIGSCIAVSAVYLLAIYIGIPTVFYLANWLLEAILPFDLLKGISYHGFGLTAWVAYYKSVYTFPIADIWDLLYLLAVLSPIGLFSLLGYTDVSLAWDDRKKVLQEIQRRKNCPDRQ